MSELVAAVSKGICFSAEHIFTLKLMGKAPTQSLRICYAFLTVDCWLMCSCYCEMTFPNGNFVDSHLNGTLVNSSIDIKFKLLSYEFIWARVKWISQFLTWIRNSFQIPIDHEYAVEYTLILLNCVVALILFIYRFLE